eukprot:Clim_evm61s33 gene=Clim_evmTU61s33
MVPKKTNSKRMSTRQRAKIDKKIREHKRKQRKEQRKNPSMHRKKKKEDPGIPNLWPFKQQLLGEREEMKQKMEEQKRRQMQQRKALVKKLKAEGKGDIDALAAVADRKRRLFDVYKDGRGEVMGALDHDGVRDKGADRLAAVSEGSRKAFFKEVRKVLDACDVILEVLDARDPIGCRCIEMEEMIQLKPDKKLVIILNKIDLVPRESVEGWLKYLRKSYPTLAFKANTQEQKTNKTSSKVSLEKANDSILKGGAALGTDMLMKLLKNYCRNAGIKTAISVGVIGYPNVGKSSLINSLKRSKAVSVGATPGVTKQAQEIFLDKHIKLYDSPGVVFSSNSTRGGRYTTDADILLRNAVKIEQIEDPIPAVEVILSRCNRMNIMERYNIPEYRDAHSFLALIARKRGKLRKGGVPDIVAAGKLILQDWNAGRIRFYTVPPEEDEETQEEQAQLLREAQAQETAVAQDKGKVLSGYSKEFDLAGLLDEEEDILKGLKSTQDKDFDGMVMQAAPAVEADNAMYDEDGDEAMYDDDDDDDEDVDDMADEDEDEIMAQKPKKRQRLAETMQIDVSAGSKKAKKQTAHRNNGTAALDDEDEDALEINQQRNRSLKRSQKIAKRDRSRAAARTNVVHLYQDSAVEAAGDSGMVGEDAYDFGVDYVVMDDGADSDGDDF